MYVQHTSLTILGPEWPQPAPAVSVMRATGPDGSLQSAGRIVASAVALAAVVLAWAAPEAEVLLAAVLAAVLACSGKHEGAKNL